MIITKTPYRISFFGGGTDYPTWFEKHPGAVLTSSINKYSYIYYRKLPPFLDHLSQVVSYNMERIKCNSTIEHPLVKALLEYLSIKDGVSIYHDGDLPARSGLGSSSVFTVGALQALAALNKEPLSKHELAQEAIHVERHIVKDEVGLQDQVEAAFGGINKIEFYKDHSFKVFPLNLSASRVLELQSNMMLFYTGVVRQASHIAAQKVAHFDEKQAVLQKMYEMVDTSIDILDTNKPIEDFGILLDETWRLKKSIADPISTALIDDLYSKALDAGALGGKILGAGGGGFFLLFVPPENQNKVLKALDNFLHIPFEFEFLGSKILWKDEKPL